jgi:dihydroflavonol-4-reductase
MILVTGGTGLTGSHLLYHLLQKEEKVRVLIRPSSDTENVRRTFSFYTAETEKLFSKIQWVQGDILDIHSLVEALEGVDQVYHTAALISFNPKDEKALMDVNVKGTANVVNACLDQKVKKLAYVSSVAALGRAGNFGLTDENSEWKFDKSLSAYAISKFEAEREVWRGMAEGLKAVVVNPAIILGPGNFDKGSIRMFQTVFNGLKVFTPGVNGYVDVNDVARALIFLMESYISGERFVLVGENVSYQKLFDMMARALGVESPRIRVGKVLSELSWRLLKVRALFTGNEPLITKFTARTANSVYRYSNEKIVKAMGIRFTPIEETVNQTAALFLKTR